MGMPQILVPMKGSSGNRPSYPPGDFALKCKVQAGGSPNAKRSPRGTENQMEDYSFTL